MPPYTYSGMGYYPARPIPTPRQTPQQPPTQMPRQTPIHTPTQPPYVAPPADDVVIVDPVNNVYTNPLYTQGFLAENVGRYVKVEFLIGTNMLVDREGTLREVGISYIVLQEPETDDLLLCDIYSIKFVRFFY